MEDHGLDDLLRSFDRVVEPPARRAFIRLLLSVAELGLFVLPVHHGKFSAVHLATRPDAKPYGEAEFAFKGASDHLRWWFRRPCFEAGIVDADALPRALPERLDRDSGDIACDIRSLEEAEQMIDFLRVSLRDWRRDSGT